MQKDTVTDTTLNAFLRIIESCSYHFAKYLSGFAVFLLFYDLNFTILFIFLTIEQEPNLLVPVIKQEQPPGTPLSILKTQEPPPLPTAAESTPQDELKDIPSDQRAVKQASAAIEGSTDEENSDSGGEGMYRERDEFVVKIEDIDSLKVILIK